MRRTICGGVAPFYSRASDHSLLVLFGDEISPLMLDRVRRLFFGIRRERGVINLHPGYASLLISFDPRLITHEAVEALAREADSLEMSVPAARTVEIPVCYGGDFGPDLGEVAEHCGLSIDRVIELHSSAEYLVHFLGFSPGFAYLGGMPEAIATPRLTSPRVRVEAGSVGIAGKQTGVYPLASPGGWRIIGRTPLRLFSLEQEPPALLAMGDRVRFRAIGSDEFDAHC
ncbi:MAG TPA: 5-oxoprolinase subunit PxpB [Bryobacteraceae bacterium]|nr:5-oxoprolinase subunit PxpB [Bryobacteraceae bacterium]